MKKARRVRVDGEDWQYFVDPGGGAVGPAQPQVIFYAPDGRQHRWLGLRRARAVSPAEAKAKIRELRELQRRAPGPHATF